VLPVADVADVAEVADVVAVEPVRGPVAVLVAGFFELAPQPAIVRATPSPAHRVFSRTMGNLVAHQARGGQKQPLSCLSVLANWVSRGAHVALVFQHRRVCPFTSNRLFAVIAIT
jgi:hypothetical protein